MNSEAVIKFHLDHETRLCCTESEIEDLSRWRKELRDAGLVGQDAARYDGFGFGNLSRQMRDGTILITASQTGHVEDLGPEGYARIIKFNPSEYAIGSVGMNHPSSETMSHLAVYNSNRAVRFVFHVHCPEIWNVREVLGLPTTDPSAECGTVEMFREVRRLLRSWPAGRSGILAMGGHTDGLLAWGETADQTGRVILSLLSRAVSP